MSAILEVNNLSVKYKEISEIAVENISFQLQEGTLTALLGPNGSGKSTILKAILEFIPYEGKILLFNKPVKHSIKKIGYVPQNFRLDDSFPITVYEFLSLTACSKIKKNTISDTLRLVDLQNFMSRQLCSLSGGQLQRILIARALIRKPKLLILDEPEAGIDVLAGQKFYELLQNLVKNEGLTVLISTHEIEIVRSFSDQVLCVNKSLICKGKPKEAITAETLNKMFSTNISFHRHS